MGDSTERLKKIALSIVFKASNYVPVAKDNRPYSIKLLYVIAYWDITGDIRKSAILSAYANDDSSLKNQIRGAFKYTEAGTPAATWSPKNMQSFGMTFASSNVVPTSPEDRPYCIKLLYVIAFWETLEEKII